MIGFDTLIKEHDMIMHRIHRHEPPVSSQKINIIYQDDKLVVVDKPGSIPVHPSGRYRHNTAMFILAHEYGITNLHTIHRLDRLTSGLLLLAKSSHYAREFSLQIRGRQVRKEYLARVVGEFPEAKLIVDQPILLTMDIGLRELNRVDSQGKPCITHFERLFFDGKESVVRCLPLTGRTHQIRVHLQWLGHPIVNDPLYNAGFRTRFGQSWEIEMGQSKPLSPLRYANSINISKEIGSKDIPFSCAPIQLNAKSNQSPMKMTNERYKTNMIIEIETAVKLYIEDHSYIPNEPKIDILSTDPSKTCKDCTKTYRDPYPFELEIYLHALCYSGDTFSYKTKIPEWAHEGYISPDYLDKLYEEIKTCN